MLPEAAPGSAAQGYPSPLVTLLRREGAVVAGALALVAALGWIYLFNMPMAMPGDEGTWEPGYLAFSFAMWFVMMVAMMTPSVAPVVLLYDLVMRGNRPGAGARTLSFFAGYLLAWALFSGAATLAQAVLIAGGVVDAMTVVESRFVAAGLLLGVAVYQWSPAKAACLEHCHSPLAFMTRRRHGPARDLRAGLAHGGWCVGCCWGLMLLLFVGGAMNLAWVAAVTVAVSLEKLGPRPLLVRRAIGVAALVASGWLALTPVAVA